MARVVLLLGLVLVALVQADDPYVCTNTCSYSDDAKPGIQYQSGQHYKYEYKGEVIGKSRVRGDGESKMAVTADVIITARTECDLKMQVANLIMEDVPEEESSWFKDAVEKYDMHFSFQDGWMEYLCPHEDEDVAATNFKRGILSAMQTTVTNAADQTEVVVQESDVSGECETRYQITGEGDVVFNKTKLNCHYNSYLPFISNGHDSADFGEANLPFFKSDKNCKMDLSQGVWKSIECKESIQVESPFSASTDASIMASMDVSSTLMLQSGPEPAQGNFSDNGHRQTRESLRMDLPGAITASEARKNANFTDLVEQIDAVMNTLVETIDGDAKERPYAFANLLDLVGKFQQQEDIEETWMANSEDENRRQFLLDALMLCENQHCMRLLSNMSMASPDIMSVSKVKTWLTGSHFFTKVDPEAINITMELVNNMEEVKTQALIAASTMVNRVCQEDPDNCRMNAEPFLEYVEEQIDDSCGQGKYPSQLEEIRVALRALANAGIQPYKKFSRKCYKNKNVASNLRVAAIQTYRRSGCPSDHHTLWKILDDKADDVEVRLAAYISLVPCAIDDPKFFTHIKHLLTAEDVNQVGSYIWTHIQNLVNEPSSSVYYHELSKLAREHTLQAKYNTNGFRSSRNYCYSQFSELMNMGGSVESNVIFSPESYIPQHVSSNFTLDILEKNFNIFEFGGDFSGLEEYIEKLFGKDGYFRHEGIQTLVENMRPKRDIREEKIKEFQRLYDEAQTMNELDEVQPEEAKASFYLRIFGDEVLYVDNLMRSDPIKFIRKLASELVSPKSYKIIDQEYVATTQIGFPFRVRVNATSSVSFDHISSSEPTDYSTTIYENKLIASAVIAVEQSMIVDGYGSLSGVRRRSTKTLQTDFGTKLEMGELNVIGIQVKVPKPEVAKISSSAEVYLYKNTEMNWHDEAPTAQNEKSDCSPEFISRILGLEICHNSKFTTHLVGQEEFSGEPYDNELTIMKADNFPYYQFFFKIEQNFFEAIYEAPGSEVPRKIRFLVNLGPDGTGGYIVIEGMGYGLSGQYQNTDTLKEISLKYSEGSVTKGGIEVSLSSEKERGGFKYTPKFELTVGPDIFQAEGTLDVHHQLTGFKSSVNLEGSHVKIDGRTTVGQSFGSLEGKVNVDEETSTLQLQADYGTDKENAHSLTLNIEEGGNDRLQGQLFLQSTQVESNLTLSYAYIPSDIQANGSVVILGKEVSSQIVMKNLDDEEGRDFQITLGLLSPQYDIDYLCKAVYKASDNALQLEATAFLGSGIRTSAAFSYLYHDDPLLFLIGSQFKFNEHLYQAETSIDLSQHGKTQITVSGTFGPAMGQFLLQSNHDQNHPFNTTIDVHGNYDSQNLGLSISVTSDEYWEFFTGSTKVNFFDTNYTLKHEAEWKPESKNLTLTLEDFGVIEITTRLSARDPLFKFLFRKDEDDESDPDFQILAGMDNNAAFQLYEIELKTGSDSLFVFSSNMTHDQEFKTSLTLLESELTVTGQYSMASYNHFEGLAQVEATLPSGEMYSTNASLNYTNDNTFTKFEISSTYGDEIIESGFSMIHQQSWFYDDITGMNISLVTPFTGLMHLGLSLELHEDLSIPNFVMLEWEEIKLQGVFQVDLPDKFEATLQYEDSGTCGSRFSIYHNGEDHQLNSGVILRITEEMDPWAIEVNTSLIHDYYQKSLDLALCVQSPMLENPFEGSLMYNITNSKFDFDIDVGFEEKVKLSVESTDMKDGDKNKFLGSIEMTSPWNELMLLNLTGNYDHKDMNIFFEFQSSIPSVESFKGESTINHIWPDETKISFQVNHEEVQILMAYKQKSSSYSFIHDLEGSINTFTITYDLETEWDYYRNPMNAISKLSLLNIFDHNLELAVSFKQDSNYFASEVSGLWDDQGFKFGFNSDQRQSLDWSHAIEILIPGYDDMLKANVSMNAVSDLSQVDFKSYFDSPWTEDYEFKYIAMTTYPMRNYDIELLQGSLSLLRSISEINGPLNSDESNIGVKFTSALFEDTQLSWMHNFYSEESVAFNFTYGSDVYFGGKSDLKIDKDWLNEEFKSYNFIANVSVTEPMILFSSIIDIDSKGVGEISLKFNDYSAQMKSAIFDGVVFQGDVEIPDTKFSAELLYKKGRQIIPDISLKVLKNEIELINANIEFNSIYPQLEAVTKVKYANEDESIKHNFNFVVTADLDYGYGIKGTAKLSSDLDGFENHTLSIDTKVNIAENSWGGFFTGHLQLNEATYETGVNGSLSIGPRIMLEMGAGFHTMSGSDSYTKDAGILFTLTRQQCKLKATVILDHTSPHWALLLQYKFSNQKLTGHVTLGDDRKYTIMMKFDSKIFHINMEIVEADDSTFKVIQGNVNWNIRKEKKQINLNMKSDFPPINKITGLLTISRQAAALKLSVNDEKATVQIRFVTGKRAKPDKLYITVENNIYSPLSTVIDLEMLRDKEMFKTDLKIDLNEEEDWITATLKVGVPEHYLRFKTPFSGMDNFNLTINTQEERKQHNLNINLEVPQFCFNLDSFITKSLKKSSLDAKVLLNCEEANKYQFLFNYEVDFPENMNVSTKLDLNGYTAFDINGYYEIKRTGINSEIKGIFMQDYSFGTTFAGTVKERESLSMNLRVYEPNNNTTFLSFEVSNSKAKSKLYFELLSNTINLEANHILKSNGLDFSSSYSHSVLEHDFNINATINAKYMGKSSNLMMHIETDTSYDIIDLSASYDIKKSPFEVTFDLSTPTGNATLKGINTKTEKSNIFTVNMLSTLHTFHDYHYELILEKDSSKTGRWDTLKFISAQDNIKFEFLGNVSRERGVLNLDLHLDTPFKAFESFNLTFTLPRRDRSPSTYGFSISTLVNDEMYIFNSTLKNYQQNVYTLEISIFSPYDTLKNVTFSFKFEPSSYLSIGLDSRRGQLGFDAIWLSMESSITFKLKADLSYFNQGQFIIDIDVPFHIQEAKVLKLIRKGSKFDFDILFEVGKEFKNGQISFSMNSLKDSDKKKIIYSLMYSYENALKINIKFDEFEAMFGFEVYGYPYSLMAGKFEVNTNYKDYKSFKGTWSLTPNGSIYRAELMIDVDKEGLITFDATLDTKAHSVATPWDSVRLDILFESPFTLSHSLHAEYQSRILTFSVSYKYGLDTFYINAGINTHPSYGTLSFKGKIPVYGISSFDVNLRYTIAEQSSLNLAVTVEETSSNLGLVLSSTSYEGSFKASLVSPFINPLGFSLTISNSHSNIFIEIKSNYGAVKGGMKMTLKYSDASAEFEMDISPELIGYIINLNTASRIGGSIKYDFSDQSKMFASLLFTVDDHSIEAKADSSVRKAKASLNLTGVVDFMGFTANMTMVGQKNNNYYEVDLNGEMSGIRPFAIHFKIDGNQIHGFWKYNSETLLDITVDKDNAKVEFYWDRRNNFNLTGYLKPIKNGQEIGFDFVNQNMQTVNVQAWAVSSEPHRFSVAVNTSWTDPLKIRGAYQSNRIGLKVTYGEAEYSVNTRFKFHPTEPKATLNLNFDSTDDPENPITIYAFFDFKDFMKGNMNSVKNITYVSFEWQEKMDLSVKAFRNPTNFSLFTDMTTPLTNLPKLNLGVSWELVRKRNHFILDFDSYIRWSKEITVSGLTKLYKNRSVDVTWSLTTPFSLLEELTIGFLWKDGQSEAQVSYNKKMWKLNATYSLSPFSSLVILETPLLDFQYITLSTSFSNEPNTEFEALLKWPGSNTLGIQISLEKRKIEIGLVTPWSPFTKVDFVASLKKISDRTLGLTTLQWDKRKIELSAVFSLSQYGFSCKYFVDAKETIIARVAYAQTNKGIDFEAEIKTPYSIEFLNVIFKLKPKGFTSSIKINDMESKINGEFTEDLLKIRADTPFLGNLNIVFELTWDFFELNTYATFDHSAYEVPVNVSLTYHYEPYPYPFVFKSIFEVKSDVKLISIMIDVNDDIDIVIHFLQNILEMKMMLLKSDRAGMEMLVYFESEDLHLETMNLDLKIECGLYWEYLNVSGILDMKLKDQFLSKHELLLYSRNDYRYITTNLELHSGYFSDPIEVKSKIPLFDIFTAAGEFELSAKQGSQQTFKLYYETSTPNRNSFLRQLIIILPEWEFNLEIATSSNSLKISLSYPNPEDEHTFILSWTHSNSERFTLSAEIKSSYLDSGKYNFDLDFVNRDERHITLESELVMGTKKIKLNGLFHYNQRQKEAKFEAQLTSNLFGDHSVHFDVSWKENILLNLKIIVQGIKHTLSIVIDTGNYTFDLSIYSSLIPTPILISIRAKPDDYNRLYELKGNFKYNHNEIEFDGSIDFARTTSSYTLISSVTLNDEIIFELTHELKFNQYGYLRTVSIYSESTIPELNLNLFFEIDDIADSDNEIIFLLRTSFINTGFVFEVRKNWLEHQSFSFFFNEFSIGLKANWSLEKGEFHSKGRYFDKRIIFDLDYSNYGKQLSTHIATPFKTLEMFQFHYEVNNFLEFADLKHMRDGEELHITFYMFEDQIFNKAIRLHVFTPYNGYETFSFQSPHYTTEHTFRFVAMIEYPSGKTGIDLAQRLNGFYDTENRLVLWLPFEKQEIISLQCVSLSNEQTLEVRIGKFGFTFSFKEPESFYTPRGIALIRVNDYKIKIHGRDVSINHKFRFDVHIETEPKDYFGDASALDLYIRNEFGKTIHLHLKNEVHDYVNLHFAWNGDRAFTIVTPKVYPGYVHINFETKEHLDDYKLELGLANGLLPEEGEPWDIYGFQAHQDILSGGRHLELSGEAFGGQFSIGGTASLDHLHLNNSLVFELNNRKLGYELLFQKHPGFFSDVFNNEVSVILPNQTVYWNTSVENSRRQFQLSSWFTWNENDPEMPPIVLDMNYDDNSLFDEKNHEIQVIFDHPENNLVTFQGNLTKMFDTPFEGLWELIDGNDPERNVVILFDLYPSVENEGEIIHFNVSQPFSNFTLAFDAQIENSIFSQADYSINYWSLSKERMEEIFVTTLFNSSENAFNFMIDLQAPEIEWGYIYEGSANQLDSAASFSLQGTSIEFNDYWKFETKVDQHLPEMEVKLHIGLENQEPFETGRLRMGLHNPLEMGAILDHERFGVLEQSGRIGLNLKAESILQLLFEFDPSLDYLDQDFLARLTSPADQIKDAWLRDFNSTVSSIKDWGFEEIPTVFKAMINQETLQTIWDREESNIGYLKVGFLEDTSEMYEDVIYIWTDVLVPIWEASYAFIIETYQRILEYSELVINYMSELSMQVMMVLTEYWTIVENFLAGIFNESIATLTQTMTDYYMGIVERFNNLVTYVQELWTVFTEQIITTFYSMVDYITTTYIAVATFVEETATSMQTVIQPYFDALSEAFTKYRDELIEILSGSCLGSITTKVDGLINTFQEVSGAGTQFFVDFLQFNEFYSRFVAFKDQIIEWAVHLLTLIGDTMVQIEQHTIEYGQQLFTVLNEGFTVVTAFFEGLKMKMETEGFTAYVEEKIGELKDQITGLGGEALAMITEYYKTLVVSAAGNIVFDYVEAVSGNVYGLVNMVWNQWRHEQRVDLNTLQRIAFSIADLVEKFLKDKNYFLDELYVYKLGDYGRIEYSQVLPVEWNSFLESPKWHAITRIIPWESPVKAAKRSLNEGLHDIGAGWGAFNLRGSMTPPFTATATVFGHHVTTFDLHHYQFSGTCTYLLAKDFKGNEFEVIGNYDRSDVGDVSLRSLQIRTPDADVYLFVNGQYVVRKRGTAEMHSGDEYVAMKMDDLFVTCNKMSRGCSITVSGKYFGRLGGLLGNYNYEPSDDQAGPDGSYARHSAELGRMWAISSHSCYQGDQFIPVDDLEEAEVEPCRNLFLQSSSPFSNCFHQVDPRPYFDHCIRGQNQPDFGQNLDKSPCDAVAAYRTQCSSQGVHIPSLEECQEGVGTCDVFGDMVPTGWNKTFQAKSDGSADIALIVEAANCNKNKDMIDFVNNLMVQFENSGIVDVRYGLTVISRESIDTAGRFMAAAELMSELRSLSMRGPPSSSGMAEGAVLHAASKLQWRPGVSRTVVQLSCLPCESGIAIEQALYENDVTYHLLSRENPQVEGLENRKRNQLTKSVFGYDEKFVYKAGDYRKIEGDADDREYIVDSPGSCKDAAQKSNGTFFNSLKWNPKKTTLTRKFLDVVSRRVVQSSTSPVCQKCRCGGRGARPTLICQKCSTVKVDETTKIQEDVSLNEEIKRNFVEFYQKKKATQQA